MRQYLIYSAFIRLIYILIKQTDSQFRVPSFETVAKIVLYVCVCVCVFRAPVTIFVKTPFKIANGNYLPEFLIQGTAHVIIWTW